MYRKFSVILILFLLGPALKAQDGSAPDQDSLKTYNLSGVVITATRLTTPEIEIASSVTVIGEKEIENSNKTALIDLLREVPGLSVTRQGGPGTNASVFLRGANPNHTLVLVDGVSMNDPSSLSNSFDFTNLQTDNIERIEILRGPQSTLYGSDALAGVISIFTKKGSGSPRLNLSAMGGSFNTYKANAAFSGSNDLVNYSVSYSALNTKGFSAADEINKNFEADGTRNTSLLSRIGIQLNHIFSIDAAYNFFKAKTDLDQNHMNGDDPNFVSNIEESVFRGAFNAKLFNGLWQQTLAFSELRHINHTTDEADAGHKFSSAADFDGTKYKLEWQNNLYLNSSNTVSFGLENIGEKASTYYTSDEYGPYTSFFPESEVSTTGMYLQDQFSFAGSIFGTVGLRLDNHSKFGSQLTYRIAPAYLIKATGTKLKATYGTGFKSPSLYYLLDPMTGNPDLKPEKSRGFDAGIEQYFLSSKLMLGITYFNNQFTDLLGFGADFKTVNINSAESRGAEFTLSTLPVNNISLKAGYTYTESRNTSKGAENNSELIRRPKNKFILNIDYVYNNINLNAEVINTGRRTDNDYDNVDPLTYAATKVTLPEYTVVNLAGSYKVTKNITLLGRIDNLFNRKYEEVLYYGTPGFSGYFGLRLGI